MEENIDVNVETNDTKETEVKTYTQDEVMALLQSEADKRVTQALKKQQKEYEKKISLSGLDEQQRKQAEKDIYIQELEDKLKELSIVQTKSEISEVLQARGLDVRFADLIEIGEDIKEAQVRIDSLDKLFKLAVKSEVEKRISGTIPKISTAGLDGTVSKEQFSKMSITEQTELYKNNKELYMSLTR